MIHPISRRRRPRHLLAPCHVILCPAPPARVKTQSLMLVRLQVPPGTRPCRRPPGPITSSVGRVGWRRETRVAPGNTPALVALPRQARPTFAVARQAADRDFAFLTSQRAILCARPTWSICKLPSLRSASCSVIHTKGLGSRGIPPLSEVGLQTIQSEWYFALRSISPLGAHAWRPHRPHPSTHLPSIRRQQRLGRTSTPPSRCAQPTTCPPTRQTPRAAARCRSPAPRPSSAAPSRPPCRPRAPATAAA